MSCFTFSLHPLHFPPTSKLPVSPWRECPSSHPWGGYSRPWARQSGSSSLGRPGYPPSSPPSQAWGHFRKCPKGSLEKGWRKLDHQCIQLSTPVLSGQSQGQGRPSLLHPWELFKTDLCLAQPPIPVSPSGTRDPCFFSCPQNSAPQETGQRMMTASAPPFLITPGLTARDLVEPQNCPRTRSLC